MQVLSFIAPATLSARGDDTRARWSDRLNALFHRLVALVGLVMLSPLLALIAAAICLTDGAPVFFKHYRVGRDGALFVV